MIFIYTYQAIALADENGKTYESKYGTYSKQHGIKLSDKAIRMLKEDLIEKLFHEDCWSLKKEPKKMTKEEIEKALGYEIEIDDKESKTDDKVTINSGRTVVDSGMYKNYKVADVFDIFDFGIDEMPVLCDG